MAGSNDRESMRLTLRIHDLAGRVAGAIPSQSMRRLARELLLVFARTGEASVDVRLMSGFELDELFTSCWLLALAGDGAPRVPIRSDVERIRRPPLTRRPALYTLRSPCIHKSFVVVGPTE